MKSLYIFLLAAAVLLAGCDPVASDDRFIEVPAATVQRNVLIEDFTGQRCIFCPDASDAIAQLQARYSDDKLIAVAIHAGPLALKSKSGFTGLRTDVVMPIIRNGLCRMCRKPLSIVGGECSPRKLGLVVCMMSLLGRQRLV